MSEYSQLVTTPCFTLEQFLALQRGLLFEPRFALELDLARRLGGRRRFKVPGYCAVDRQLVSFSGDWRHSSVVRSAHDEELRIPNWRESLVCPRCRLNNRQRAVVSLLSESLARHTVPQDYRTQVYLMEQVTPLFEHLSKSHQQVDWVGSEYLGPDHVAGRVYDGIRHEDAHRLSFEDASFDMTVSCSVLEHVPDPWHVIAELARVLRPGGDLFLEVPFHSHTEETVRRAEVVEGDIVHHLPAEYHDNPTTAEGVLVYNDFGWDFVERMRRSGFSNFRALVYWSWELGHLGGTQSIFHGNRDGEAE